MGRARGTGAYRLQAFFWVSGRVAYPRSPRRQKPFARPSPPGPGLCNPCKPNGRGEPTAAHAYARTDVDAEGRETKRNEGGKAKRECETCPTLAPALCCLRYPLLRHSLLARMPQTLALATSAASPAAGSPVLPSNRCRLPFLPILPILFSPPASLPPSPVPHPLPSLPLVLPLP